jgi:hypothetical protein
VTEARLVPFVGGPMDGRHMTVPFGTDGRPAADLFVAVTFDDDPFLAPVATNGENLPELAPPRRWLYHARSFVIAIPTATDAHRRDRLWAYFTADTGPRVVVAVVLHGARASCQLDDRAEVWQPGGLLLTRPRKAAPIADRVLAKMVNRATYWLEMRDWTRHMRRSLNGNA